MESPACLAASAAAVLALHTSTGDGACAQCRAEGRSSPYPCPRRGWAESIQAHRPRTVGGTAHGTGEAR
ncbi:hypothetical protein O7627_36940 [Solwaraspora sp. WMMD1047]|nr:hypothetical protein [Solwaraspora sp. WMMD1047]MDG4834858.1 hypothetical protein [Solwaraspora sp. WMMD1047]